MRTIQKLLVALVVVGAVYGAYTVGMALRGSGRTAYVTPSGQPLSKAQVQREQAQENALVARWSR